MQNSESSPAREWRATPERPDSPNAPRTKNKANQKKKCRKVAHILPLTLDKRHAPGLAAKSLDLQTREIFQDTVANILFPSTYAAYRGRVDQDLPSFIHHEPAAQHPLLGCAVQCTATWFLAKIHSDANLLDQSRYLYSGALRYLSMVLHNPAWVKSDMVLCTAIVLMFYEMMDEITPTSWTAHGRGIKEIFRIRGARMHLAGFARTLLVIARPFLIVDAFVHQEPCFLEASDWNAVCRKSFLREQRMGRGGKLSRLIEEAYAEVALVPGYRAEACRILDGGRKDASTIHALLSRMQGSHDQLAVIERQLGFLLASDVAAGNAEVPAKKYSDPIPEALLPRVGGLTLQGIQSSLGLLKHLEVQLENHGKPVNQPGSATQAISASSLASLPLAEIGNLFDSVSLGMGALSVGPARLPGMIPASQCCDTSP